MPLRFRLCTRERLGFEFLDVSSVTQPSQTLGVACFISGFRTAKYIYAYQCAFIEDDRITPNDTNG